MEFDSAGRWTAKDAAAPVQPPALPCRLSAAPVRWHYAPEGEFALQLDGNLPPLGWSHLLVNPRFGWLTDETGCGHLWQGNARETPITPWNNDPLSIGGPEWFLLTWQGGTHSLFADGDGMPVTVTYGFGWARWEKVWPGGTVRTTALVPWGEDRRLLLVEVPAGGAQVRHITRQKGETLYGFSEQLCLATGVDGTAQLDETAWEPLFSGTVAQWRKLVQPLRVKTPDATLNDYLNGWCLYQVIACRLLARTSHYQNGGAYGFRDQLQDTLALLPLDPAWTREQILRCCAHQFKEGDVQHWWHETGDGAARGVRTRISDDLLWLPYAVGAYVRTWSDWALLSEKVIYLSGEPLRKEEMERYFIPPVSEEAEDVYTHALRAIQCALDRGVGEHGLLKMGTGDWNDGMNHVGAKGQGESVWLTWFAVSVLDGFCPLAQRQGDRETEALCRVWAERLQKAAEEAWDGRWFLRGWYDDGEPLGSRLSEECQIDSIPQSWAVLAGCGGEKGETALRSVLERLFDRKEGIVKLFTPAFDDGQAQPGYIRAYLPGVRENGGQYTHAAVWAALACFRLGWAEEGCDMLLALLPAAHLQERYKAEPYVLAGDVYSHPDHPGRGGWSWYTGAAGWYYQAAIKGLLGIEIENGQLTVSPSLPQGWPGWTVRWQGEGWTLHITARRGAAAETALDGKPVPGVALGGLKGEHTLEVTVAE